MAVTDEKKAELDTKSEQNKAVFVLGILGIWNQTCIFILKCRFGLVERNAVLPLILRRFPAVPFKRNFTHLQSVTTL